MSNFRGFVRTLSSTLSVGIALYVISDSKLVRRIWRGSNGTKGRNTAIRARLTILPYRLEVANNMYFNVLLKVRRAIIMPSQRLLKFFGSKMMSADCLAMLTTLLEEMPTSALVMVDASLMPSPRNPTTCPLLFNVFKMRLF